MLRSRCAVVIGMFVLAACGGDDDAASNACLPALPRDCQIQYQPTFDEIYTRELSRVCANTEACHASATAKGAQNGHGLVLSQADTAYDLLLGNQGGRARVLPGDPECSLLMQRLESKDPAFQMPPGMPLSDAELCTITQWIANGAQR